jgi:hypothetical protein
MGRGHLEPYVKGISLEQGALEITDYQIFILAGGIMCPLRFLL